MKFSRSAKIGDVLEGKTAGVATIRPSESIATLTRRLQQEKCGAMVVSRDGCRLDGLISERDVAYALALYRGQLHTLHVSELMTKSVTTCAPDDRVVMVSKLMADRRIRHIPVVEDGRLVGLIGTRDVFMHRLDEIEQVTNLLRSYVSAGD